MSAAPSLYDANPQQIGVPCSGCGRLCWPRSATEPRRFCGRVCANRTSPLTRKQPHGYRSRHGGSGPRGEGV